MKNSKNLEGGNPDKKRINPLDVKNTNQTDKKSKIIDNIVSNESAGKEEAILEAPTAEDDLFKNIISSEENAAPTVEVNESLLYDVKPSKSLFLILLKMSFGLLTGASIASFIFFTSQLTNHFDFIKANTSLELPNVSQEVAASNDAIIVLQTDFNFYRYLEAKGHLDEFSYYGDSFLQYYEIENSKTALSSEKKEAGNEMIKLRKSLRDPFLSATDKLKYPISADIVAVDIGNDAQRDALFITELKSKLQEKAKEFANNEEAQIDYKNYVYTLNIVGNGELFVLLRDTDIDALTDVELYEFIKDVNSLVVNDLSIIQQVKDERIRWSDIMSEIEYRTLIVDQSYSKDSYDEYGGIRYTSYNFDSKDQSISIVGETKRFDATNFTMIASLIDELNNSDLFEGAEMRSFSKSGSTDNGYTATIKITMNLAQ